MLAREKVSITSQVFRAVEFVALVEVEPPPTVLAMANFLSLYTVCLFNG